jgi:ATP-dependent DNA ligase
MFELCLPSKVPQPPAGDNWVHEIKHDGYRLIARRIGNRVSLYTRRGFDWGNRYPRIVAAVLKLPVKSVVLDGDGAWIDDRDVSDFNALHSRLNDLRVPLCTFDLLDIDGEDLRKEPLLGTDRSHLAPLDRLSLRKVL